MLPKGIPGGGKRLQPKGFRRGEHFASLSRKWQNAPPFEKERKVRHTNPKR